MRNFHCANMSISFIGITERSGRWVGGFTVQICLFLRLYYRNGKHHWTRPRQLPPVENRLDQQPQHQKNPHQRNNNTAREMVSTSSFRFYLIPPSTRCGKVMFSVMPVSQSVQEQWGFTKWPLWTCSNVFNWDLPHPGLFKLLHYVTLTSISKRTVALRMKRLLVNLKFAHMLDVCIDASC